MADQALALLDIMDFEGKDLVEDKVRQNGTMLQMLTMWQQIALNLAVQSGQGDVAEALAQNVMGANQAMGISGQGGGAEFAGGVNSDAVQGLKPEEHPFVQKARAQAQAVAQPGGTV
jgi:hypothetical protein